MDHVERSLAKHLPLSKTKSCPEGWLTATWSEDLNQIVYGCKLCIPPVQNGSLELPNRYRDPQRSNSFCHGNLWQDLKRAIPSHSDSTKIHAERSS